MPFSHTACIALGSNMADREATLLQALDALHSHPAIEVVRCSAIYETAPVGYAEQPPFLNMAALLRTSLDPRALLTTLLAVEQTFGRTREVRWGPRTLDLDLLLYEDMDIALPDLIVPHPRMLERAFVLIPLRDIIVEEPFAGSASVLEALDKLEGKEGVVLWKEINWPNASGRFAN